MVADIDRLISDDVRFFLVCQDEQESVVRHLLEKIYLPIPVLLDNEGAEIGARMYMQPQVGIPFGRAYVIDGSGVITSVLTGYAPGRTLEAIEAARM